MLGLWAEVQLEVTHGISAIREKGELLIHLEPLGLPELEQAALGLRVNGLDKAKALTRGNVFLVLPCEGQDTFPHDDLKLPLFLVPITHIPTIDPDRERTIGHRQMAPVPRAPLDEKHLLFPQLGLTPLGHGQGVGTDRGRAERLVDREEVRERLYGEAIGDQRGPLRFHEEQLRSGVLWEEFRQGATRGRLLRSTGAVAESWSGQPDGPKERPEGEGVVPLGAEGSATCLAVHAPREKGGGLPFYNLLLQRGQEGFRLCQGQTDLFDLLACLLQDDHVSDGRFVTIVVIDHQV